MSEDQPPAPLSKKKERSPSFPFITLTKALERARLIYNAAKRHEARLIDLSDALNNGPKSSGTIQTVAALMAFGLLEDSGSGENRKFKISDLAFKALEDQRPGARDSALSEAALKPSLVAEFADRWKEGRPNDTMCVSELRFERGFTEEGAKTFLRVFDDAISYTALHASDKSGEGRSNFSTDRAVGVTDPAVEIGDLVQWEAGGVLRMEAPARVRATQEHDGQKWVFVDGSETGIRVSEIVVQEKAPKGALSYAAAGGARRPI